VTIVYAILAINSASIIALAVWVVRKQKKIQTELNFIGTVTHTAMTWINARIMLEIGPDHYQEIMGEAIEKSFERNPPDIDDIIKRIMKGNKNGLGENC